LRAEPWRTEEYDGSHRALALLKDMTSQLIGRMAMSIARATHDEYGPGAFTRPRGALVVPAATEAEILVLKGVAVHFLMAPRERKPAYRAQRQRLIELVHALAARGPDALEPHFAASWNDASDDAARFRLAVDQVASLTDKSAYDWHHRYVATPRKR